jgi:hypothetical protein
VSQSAEEAFGKECLSQEFAVVPSIVVSRLADGNILRKVDIPSAASSSLSSAARPRAYGALDGVRFRHLPALRQLLEDAGGLGVESEGDRIAHVLPA